jgi:coenzyme F420 biosynthesis associated uncharacterized protein
MSAGSRRPDPARGEGRSGEGRRVSGSAAVLRTGIGRAGFLVGAGLGAAATVLGRHAERSARRGLVDWDGAERVARAKLRRSPGRLDEMDLRRAAPVYNAAMLEIVPALGRVLGTPLPGVVGRVAVIDRESWVHDNVAAFMGLMQKVERGLIDRSMPPDMGLLRAVMALANRQITTRQVGFMLGFLGERVLGQYDIALLTAESAPGRLVFLDENIRLVASRLDVPLNPFRTWIALHETTHAFEFEAHPWLRPYLAGRIEKQLASLGGMDPQKIEAGRRIRRVLRTAGSGESWMEGLMSAEQRRDFREIQAVMSLLEGFGDHVMDKVGRDLVPEVDVISRRFHARRTERTGMERAIMRVTGLDLKMEQYRKGEEFVAAIEAGGGSAALRELWRGPETLPSPEEIDRPSLWLARVLPAQARTN